MPKRPFDKARRRTFRWIVSSTVLLALALPVTACRAGETSSPAVGTTVGGSAPADGQILTEEQASTMSRVLSRNFEAGGATIDADIPFSDAAHFALHAEMDWTDPKGRGTLDTTYTDGRPPQRQYVAWTSKQVGISEDGENWNQRLLDPRQHPLDQVLAIIMGLATEQRDNPAVLRDGPARYVGPVSSDGATLDHYRYADRTDWFLNAEGVLVRMVVPIVSSAGAVSITLHDVGPRTVVLP